MAEIIQIEHLTKTFGSGEGQVAALQDVSLSVQEGEIFGIIGLSGAGKSTLVRCMNLLERPESGRVLFHGQDLLVLREKQLRHIFQKLFILRKYFLYQGSGTNYLSITGGRFIAT